MKKLILSLCAVALAGVFTASAEDVTLTGKGTCAKCGLKQADKCQNALQVEKDGKTTTYLIEQNDISKAFHKEVCTETKTVKATGVVSEKDGKKILTVSKIEAVAAK
jgi:hypothetical protein